MPSSKKTTVATNTVPASAVPVWNKRKAKLFRKRLWKYQVKPNLKGYAQIPESWPQEVKNYIRKKKAKAFAKARAKYGGAAYPTNISSYGKTSAQYTKPASFKAQAIPVSRPPPRPRG